MKQASRRLTAVLCAFCMLFASMPVSAYTDLTPATPTDLAPVEEPMEQEIPEAAEPEETQESREPEEAAEDPEPATETPAEEPADPTDEAEPDETDDPEIIKPEADREVTGSDDITVSGSLEGNPPADYLVRYTPEKNQTLCLILTTNGDLKASVTDENTGAAKQFIFDHTDEDGQNVLTLPYYKVNQDSTYLIRLSGNKPAEFAIRMVKMSILKAEEESALTPEEEPAKSPEETQPEPESGTQSEPETETQPEPGTEPQAEPEIPDQPEEPASEPEQETTEPDPAEQAEPAGKEITEPEAQDTPATQTDLEPEAEPVKEEPVEIRIEATDSPVEANIVFMSDAGIPPDAVLQVRELTEAEQAAYQARTIRALKCENEAYLYYTRYLAFTLLHNGEAVDLNAPATVSVTLADVSEGIDALQVVRFGRIGAKLLDSERTGDTISFRTNSLAVFGIGNALTPLDIQETELVSVEVLSFSPDAEVSLKETKAPEVEEGLEVLGTFRVEDQTKADGTAGQDDLWIKAELNGDAELAPLESVSLYRVEDGQAEILVEDLSRNGDITVLDTQHVAVIKDTGYRHLTLTVNPDATTNDQIVTLDGMMPKEAEATVTEVTEQYTDYPFGTKEPETGHAAEAAQTETAETADNGQEQTEVLSSQEDSGIRTTLAAYDISISHADGEYQPDEDKPISVEIADSRIKTERNIELWHIRDDGTQEQVTEFTLKEGRIAFEATGFSVYAVIIHEDGEVIGPRVEFHFIRNGATELSDDTNAYYEGTPYLFRNKHNEYQSSQILSDGESLELITDPGNLTDKFFYGWYVVSPYPIAGTTDEYGIGTGDPKRLYFTWPALPESVRFEVPISIQTSETEGTETVQWDLYGVKGSGVADKDGSVHVFLAPVYEKYNFVNFMLHARDTEVSGSANNLMTRKLVAMGSAENVQIKVSDIRSTSKDAVHLIFTGWEYQDDEGRWNEINTVDPTGAEIKQPGRDGVYLDNVSFMNDTSSIDLYPLFVEARWMDFVSGISGSGASFVGSRFLESWGRATPEGTEEEEGKNVSSSLELSARNGYIFEGWYAFAVTDPTTGEITNLDEPKDVTFNYIDDEYKTHTVTVNTKAVRITDGEGTVVFDGTYSVDNGSGTLNLFSGTDGKLKFYDPLDRLTLYANWTPDTSGITIVYWTEHADDDGYTSSAALHVTTTELNAQLGTNYASGSEITLAGLQAYVDPTANVSVLDPAILDDVGAVPAEQTKTENGKTVIIEPSDSLFYDLNETKSDESKTFDGNGNAIFNVYYSRKVFKLVFHIGRDSRAKKGGNQRTDAGWDGNWIEYMYIDDKVNLPVEEGGLGYPKHPDRVKESYEGLYWMTFEGKSYTSEYVTTPQNVMGNYVPSEDENVYIISAKYGADISSLWPSPSNPAFRFYPENSPIAVYIWSAYYGSLYCRIANDRSGTGNDNGKNPDINGVYKYMSAEMCANRKGDGIINDECVHHLVAWFGEANNAKKYKQYHTLFEAVEGTYDPDTVEPVPGTDYVEYSLTTWSAEHTDKQKNEIIGHYFFESDDSPELVFSNLEPQFQLSTDLDGYEFIYSCYDPNQRQNPKVSGQKDYHVYFFYRPIQYTLTFMYENVEDRKTDTYYYNQSLKEACKYPDPVKEGYRFRGWFTNQVAGKDEQPFDFERSTMPSRSLVLYPVFEKLEYVIRIDPNGAEIDHWRTTSTSSGASTGFRADYHEKVSAYNFLERNYLKTNDNEIDNLGLDRVNEVYYYLNTQYLTEEHDGRFVPSRLRNALYLTAADIDSYWAYYSSVPDTEFTSRGATKFTDKDAWMDAYMGGHVLSELPKYRHKQGVENYSFMGWYQVYENGTLAKVPFDFNTLIESDITIRAMWRLDGGYYLEYISQYHAEDETGNMTKIVGELDQWFDPEDPTKKLYADQSPTHILRGPKNVTPGWVFRGWRVVREDEQPHSYVNEYGETVSYTNWIPMQHDANGNVIYYQPGDPFTVDSAYVTKNGEYGGLIYMQAYYEPEEDTSRRPKITNLTLDANAPYGGYINSTDQASLPALDHPGRSAIDTENHLDENDHPTQILFGDIQSNLAIHLYRYATSKTFNSVQGTELFSIDGPFFLIGFDENPDPLTPTTGSAYVPAYSPDSVIAVTRESDITLYAMWEPKIYVTFINTTNQDITIKLGGNGTTTVRIVNKVTGEYDREETNGTIVVPARSGGEDGSVEVVLPRASAGADTFTATARNDHEHKKISASGRFRDQDPYGTGSEDIPFGYDVLYSGVLQIDQQGIFVTYTEEDDYQIDFDVNGGQWTDGAPYVQTGEDLYCLDARDIGDNGYEPSDPNHDEYVFIGWTTNADVAAHKDFTGTRAVTWGDTVLVPENGESLLDVVRDQFLWDFSDEPPYDDTLYAVWSRMVTVTFDLLKTGSTLHTWNGPATTNVDGGYVFYRENENSRYVTYKLVPGEKVPKPDDPTGALNNWYFISWLTYNNDVKGYPNNNGIQPNNANIKKYTYDFSQKVTEDLLLITSWCKNQPQTYTFTVENHVVDGNDDDEFTYHITVSEEQVWGKLGASGSNTVGDSEIHWGTFDVNLKNNHHYTVLVTVKYLSQTDWDACSVEIDVIDEDGNHLKNDTRVTYANRNGNPAYVGGYLYKLVISQDENMRYSTTIAVDNDDGNIVYTPPEASSRSFTFNSKWGGKETNSTFESAFKPVSNGYVAGEENSLTIVFTNTIIPIVAPTGLISRHIPFFLMLAAGLVLMILLGGMRIRRRWEEEPDGEESPFVNTAIIDTGPPGGETSRAVPKRIGKRSNNDCEKDPVKGDLNR